MKTQVIQLDEHDDLISIRDKMSWTKAPRILLVFPYRARLLERTLDLLLLKRHSATLGAQLAAVARSPETRLQCRELSIPVFPTSVAAQRADWDVSSVSRPPARHRPHPNLRAMRQALHPVESPLKPSLAFRLLFFTIGVLAVLVVALLFLPSATVALNPQTQIQSLTITVHASPAVNAVSIAGTIPVHTVAMTVDGSKTTPATGQEVVPAGFATGSVRFENLTNVLVSIPSGTVVRTAGSPADRFATQEEAVLPSGVGKTVDVTVQALEAGPAGNLPAGSMTAIEGESGANLSVTNPLPTGGGTETTAQVQTADDRALLHDALLADLLAECRLSLPGGLAQGDLFFPETVKVAEVLAEEYFPAEDQPGDTLALTMHLTCAGLYADPADLKSLALAALAANLPDGFTPLSDVVDISAPGDFSVQEDGSVQWTMLAARPLRARVDTASAALLVVGMKLNNAASRLYAAFRLEVPPVIRITPAWWRWLPFIPFRITVIEMGN
jgi:Baseplate J-like protein